MAPVLAIVDSLSAGLLPKWLLLISAVSVANSIQAYITVANVARVYPGPLASAVPAPAHSTRSKAPALNSSSEDLSLSPVTPLSSRTFGTWTLLSGIIRAYAAFNIHDPVVYQLALWSYVVVCLHFGSEWMVYGTTRWGRGLAGPVLIGTTTLLWMLVQWDFYVTS